MAIAASPITRGKDLLDLIQQKVPRQERVVELYRRLLAINDLAALMNTAKNIEELSECVATHYQECFPEDLVRLCFINGTKYRKTRLSGPEVPIDEQELPLDQGLAGSVLKSGSRCG